MSRPPIGAPRGILTVRSPSDRLAHQRIAPSPELAPYIAHFWAVHWDLRGKPPLLVETLPHPCVHIVFERGQARVGGVATRIFKRRLQGQARVFGIKFRPAAFYPILRSALSKITNRTVTLRSVFGRESNALMNAILGESDVPTCESLSEEFFQGRLPPMPPELAELRDCVERLAADSSIVRAEQAATLAGVPLRTLQRQFSAAVGVSPKWVIKRYRLHEAIDQLARTQTRDMASLAQQLGYFDQSHFIHDFKGAVGKSPGEFLARTTSSVTANG